MVDPAAPPAVRTFIRQVTDVYLADIHAMLRLPRPEVNAVNLMPSPERLRIRGHEQRRVLTVHRAVEDRTPCRQRFVLGVDRHLLHYAASDLPAVLHDEDVGVFLEEPRDLVAIFPIRAGVSTPVSPFPLKPNAAAFRPPPTRRRVV